MPKKDKTKKAAAWLKKHGPLIKDLKINSTDAMWKRLPGSYGSNQ